MNVFVLCTGRCGSTTFARACSHITNYGAAHESRITANGPSRLNYPDNHIEADNRLSWMLGRLDQKYGRSAFYVHLWRNPADVAQSFLRRWPAGIMRVYREEISPAAETPDIEVALDLVRTVTANIELFLRDKPMQINIELETIESQFGNFWDAIAAEGDFGASTKELSVRYNASV
jgi:hypothetical protein